MAVHIISGRSDEAWRSFAVAEIEICSGKGDDKTLNEQTKVLHLHNKCDVIYQLE